MAGKGHPSPSETSELVPRSEPQASGGGSKGHPSPSETSELVPRSEPQARGGSKIAAPRPLGPHAGRMVYNLADALHPEVARDPVPELEQRLRERGLGAVRWFRFWLAWLEWEPVLTGRARRRFWRLPRDERQAACARFRGSRFAWRRRTWAQLSALVEDALEATAQSSDGA